MLIDVMRVVAPLAFLSGSNSVNVCFPTVGIIILSYHFLWHDTSYGTNHQGSELNGQSRHGHVSTC